MIRNYVIDIMNYSIRGSTFIVGLRIYPHKIGGIESTSFLRPKIIGLGRKDRFFAGITNVIL